MKHPIIVLLMWFLLSINPSLSWAQSAKDIMAKVDQVDKNAYFTSLKKIKLSTCDYVVKNKTMRCSEKPRVTVVESVLKDCGVDNRDSRSVSIVSEPISDRGIGMLIYEYDDPDKDTDNWLYLSALNKVKRMISGNEDGEDSGSFFGSEFFIEDVETRKIDDYTYKILDEGTYSEQSIWIIESMPTAKRAQKTRYGKLVSWVDKDRYIILKENLYDRHGKLYKQKIMKDIEHIDTVWVSRKVIMNNLAASRATHMELITVAYNLDVPDDFLTQRTLTDFAFRERNLTNLRARMK